MLVFVIKWRCRQSKNFALHSHLLINYYYYYYCCIIIIIITCAFILHGKKTKNNSSYYVICCFCIHVELTITCRTIFVQIVLYNSSVSFVYLFNTKVQHQLVIRGNRSSPLPLLRRNKVRLACMKSKCQRLNLKRACCCRSLKDALAREVYF